MTQRLTQAAEALCRQRWTHARGEFNGLRAALAEAKAEAQAGIKVGSPEHVALWDAIAGFVFACGGHPGDTSIGRQNAVVMVERALAKLCAPAAPSEAARAIAELQSLLDRYPHHSAHQLRQIIAQRIAELRAQAPGSDAAGGRKP